MVRLATLSVTEDTEEEQAEMPQRDKKLSHTQSNLASVGKRDRMVGQPQFHGHTLSTKGTRLKDRTNRRSGQVGEKYKRDETVARPTRLD